MNSFSSRVIAWQARHGRHALPWQGSTDPYRIWLSEIMLQQTQVATVIPYFERFIATFPDLQTLAAASEDAVLVQWSGLGYYSRGRNLWAAARTVVSCHGGRFPESAAEIARLPGVGRSTAAAIAALAFGERGAILDGNVKRVLARHGGITGWPGEKHVATALWALAESRLPDARDSAPYTQGMMDLGALVCTRRAPACKQCPVETDCVARRDGRVLDLPSPRPRKPLPEKRVQMLMLVEDGALLLEKRPAPGIWGGLWSLPELDPDGDPAQYCLSQWGVQAMTTRSVARFTHSFTHYRLHIDAIAIAPKGRGAPRAGQAWLPLGEARTAALPAPVRRLIALL